MSNVFAPSGLNVHNPVSEAQLGDEGNKQPII